MSSLENAPERAAYSINSFCAAHDMSRALLYRAWREGWGPDKMLCASKTTISTEAAARWRRDMEERARQAPAAA